MANSKTQSAASSSLFSGVLNFVAREIDSFVATAKGDQVAETPSQSRPSPKGKRVQIKSKPNAANLDFEESMSEQDTSEAEEDTNPAQNTTQDDRRISPTPYSRRNRRTTKSQRAAQLSPCLLREGHGAESSRSEHSSSPSTSLKHHKIMPRMSITMPGSLFPRSPSMDPQGSSSLPDLRYVRFEAGSPSPDLEQENPILHRVEDSHHSLVYINASSMPASSSRLGPSQSKAHSHSISSVKSAVKKFRAGENDTDASILLPSSTMSPAKPFISKSSITTTSEDPSAILTKQAKGKERETNHSFSYDDAETSGEFRVQGKERELIAAREVQKINEKRWEVNKQHDLEADKERERDKAKIRSLEDEIQRLRDELARRYTDSSFVNSAPTPPPPPPPPPPPNNEILRLPTSASNPSTVFSSARAALKPRPVPKEAPINPLSAPRKQGQPTVGITPDKMAAFLNEMKTVRLRKVSATTSSTLARSSHLPNLNRDHRLMTSNFSTHSTREIFGSGLSTTNSSFQDGIQTAGKRKRVGSIHDGVQDDLNEAIKRRSIASTSSNSTSSLTLLNRSILSEPSISSQSFPPPSRSSRVCNASALDAPTPSLCSDNGDREDDTSPDDQPPSTPPVPSTQGTFRFESDGLVPDREIIDVDMLVERPLKNPRETQFHHRDRKASCIPRPANKIFEQRPPSSPMPTKSPRRPHAPARSSRRGPAARSAEASDEEDPLSLSFTSPEPTLVVEVHPIAKKKHKPTRSGAPSSSRSQPDSNGSHSTSTRFRRDSDNPKSTASRVLPRRRQTLEEEIRDASWVNGEAEEDLESGVLVGVGTANKRRGFLAHGGAGGAPVFMGVGYVDGAEEEERGFESDSDDDARRPRSREGSQSRCAHPRSR